MAWTRKYYQKNNYLILRSKIKVPRRSLRYATHMVMHPHTNYHWPISKDKNVMARTRKYYLKNNYLTLRWKVKVPQRSLRYATHRLMVMHIQTICQWSFGGFIWIIWPWDQSPTKVITVRDTPPYGQIVFSFLGHNIFVFWDRSMIIGMWVHDHKVVCHVP
jgi:hypothetical protein